MTEVSSEVSIISVKVEAGQKGGQVSAEIVRQNVKTQDKPQFVNCSCCPMGTYSLQPGSWFHEGSRWKRKPDFSDVSEN